jgi:4-diphosphocytidyl-2-C-methyl-D-erythritol kinase
MLWRTLRQLVIACWGKAEAFHARSLAALERTRGLRDCALKKKLCRDTESMPVTVRSFAKINLGLCIGPARPDGFHELRTVYQTIGLNDLITVRAGKGTGIEIRSADPRVPTDSGNTCYRVVERAMEALGARGRVTIEIEKRLPVQGGLGGASANAVAALLALEKVLRKRLSQAERLRIAAEVGSDLPCFLVGGTALGVGRGEVVFPLEDLPTMPCVIATPAIGVSTPKAFADWDELMARAERASERRTGGDARTYAYGDKLTVDTPSDRIKRFGHVLSAWLSDASGASARGGSRAESLLLDLVRTGIENDFERVVFPQYPELRDIKGVLERAGALYASLSGSGSALYGLFQTRDAAKRAVAKLKEAGVPAQVTSTLTRPQYWKKTFN